MPESYPDFPHHTQIAAYFEEYVEHFGFRDRIVFETGVEHAARAEDGSWRIELDTGERRTYDSLIVANGHHWNPRWPDEGKRGRLFTRLPRRREGGCQIFPRLLII